nr:hypothetical protein Iba_chr07cCG2230 [Ipomoea batatas]GMD53348.1 hypothetical protein Iba_scaffold1387799CG0010 [Ipomoea batatas]
MAVTRHLWKSYSKTTTQLFKVTILMGTPSLLSGWIMVCGPRTVEALTTNGMAWLGVLPRCFLALGRLY